MVLYGEWRLSGKMSILASKWNELKLTLTLDICREFSLDNENINVNNCSRRMKIQLPKVNKVTEFFCGDAL